MKDLESVLRKIAVNFTGRPTAKFSGLKGQSVDFWLSPHRYKRISRDRVEAASSKTVFSFFVQSVVGNLIPSDLEGRVPAMVTLQLTLGPSPELGKPMSLLYIHWDGKQPRKLSPRGLWLDTGDRGASHCAACGQVKDTSWRLPRIEGTIG